MKKKTLLLTIAMIGLLFSTFAFSASFSKGKIGKQDVSWWTGTSTRTFTRATSEGYDLTLTKFDQYVDVAAAYGGNVNYTKATISSALTAVGAVNKVAFFLAPTTWTIDADLTITSNVTLIIPPGCTLSISILKYLVIQGDLIAGPYQIFSGSGSGLTRFTSNVKVQWVYPEWWGAAGDGSTDDTTAIISAMATGKNVLLTSPSGYYVDDAVVLSATAGQILSGIGQQQGGLLIDSSFDTTEDGVIELGANYQTVKDLKITFAQTDTAARGSMVTFPNAIYANARTGTKIQNVRIEEAYDGIDLNGAVSQVLVENLEMSCFNKGIEVNGATGDVKLSRLYIGNVGTLTANQQTVLAEDSTYGIYMTRCDSFQISDSFFNVGTAIYFLSGGAADPYGNISNCTFMDENGILVAAGTVNLSSSTFILDGTDEQGIEMSGGKLTVQGCTFDVNAVITDPCIDVTGGVLVVSNSILDSAALDVTMVYGTGAGGAAYVTLTGNHFVKTTDTAYAAAVISIVSDARLSANGNYSTAAGTGSGDMIAFDTDDNHIIIGNQFNGYDIDLPATPEYPQIAMNVVKAASSIDQNMLVGRVQYKVFTGTLAADGTATIAHGVTTCSHIVLGWHALYRTAANTAGMMDAAEITIDNTNINVAGTAAALNSAKYRITIMYGMYDDTDFS